MPDLAVPDTRVQSDEDLDGRRLRREHNRRAVVEALVGLYREGRYDPSAAEIAERAGLSPRSLFRYFDDTDDLARAAIRHHQALARPLLEIGAGPDEDLDTRVALLVEARVRLWESVAPSARVARMRAPLTPLISEELRRTRAFLRSQAEQLFAPELSAMHVAHGQAVLAAVDVLCSFESCELLRHDQRLARSKTVAALTQALRALFAPSGGHVR